MDSKDKLASREKRFKSRPIESRYDFLYKEREKKREKYEKKGPIVGICTEMCPELERYDRELHLDLSVFEVVSGTEKAQFPRVDHKKAIKKYHRSVAGAQPSLPDEIRTPSALRKTMNYLIELLDNKEVSFIETCNFFRDRARSIRQDLIIQSCRDINSVFVYEQSARFYIMCLHVFSGLDKTAFDAHQNEEQLRGVLQTLQDLYNENPGCSVFEGEIRSYLLLLKIENTEEVSRLLKFIFFEEVEHAAKLFVLFKQENTVEFFRLLFSCKTKYLQACLLSKLLPKMRARIIKRLIHAYSKEVFHIEYVSKLLGLTQTETNKLLSSFVDVADEKVVFFDKEDMEVPEIPEMTTSNVFITEKRSVVYSEVICGKEKKQVD